MTIEHSPHRANPAPSLIFESPERRTVASYERELIRLRAALAQKEVLLRQKEKLKQRQEVLGQESAHRLMNDLQMVVIPFP
jgi:hypothetical protein